MPGTSNLLNRLQLSSAAQGGWIRGGDFIYIYCLRKVKRNAAWYIFEATYRITFKLPYSPRVQDLARCSVIVAAEHRHRVMGGSLFWQGGPLEVIYGVLNALTPPKKETPGPMRSILKLCVRPVLRHGDAWLGNVFSCPGTKDVSQFLLLGGLDSRMNLSPWHPRSSGG